MRFKTRQVSGRCWAALGLGADIHGRIGFLIFFVFATTGIFAGLWDRVGTVTAIVVALCAVGALIGLWLMAGAVRREDKRQEMARVTGTLIPPGHAAIVTGEQAVPGEWVPPGFSVTMGLGTISDDLGNMVSGAGSRVYNGQGNTVMGVDSRVGEKPY